MQCIINGKQAALAPGVTLAAYLRAAGLPETGLVVERNGGIVPPDAWPATVLEDGDRLEIISFVAGG